MKAILINVKNHTVELIEIDSGFEAIQKAIGCDCFTVAHNLQNSDTIYVDDEGLCKDAFDFFAFKGAHQPFAGNGVVLGLDDDTGESRDVQSKLDDVKNQVKFLNLLQLNFHK